MLPNPRNLNQMLTVTAEAVLSNLQTEWFTSLMQRDPKNRQAEQLTEASETDHMREDVTSRP